MGVLVITAGVVTPGLVAAGAVVAGAVVTAPVVAGAVRVTAEVVLAGVVAAGVGDAVEEQPMMSSEQINRIARGISSFFITSSLSVNSNRGCYGLD